MTATTKIAGEAAMTDKKTQTREGFEAQRKAGMNVDWFTWQIAWHDALFTVHDIAGDSPTAPAQSAEQDERAAEVELCRHCGDPTDAPGYCVCNGARYEREHRAACTQSTATQPAQTALTDVVLMQAIADTAARGHVWASRALSNFRAVVRQAAKSPDDA
jgi:hypothetical protein